MNCRYEFSLRAVCPIDGSEDVYLCVVESPHQVYAERLLEFAASCAEKRETQEQITSAFARKFPSCRVTTTGHHSGVKTTVTV